MTYADTVAPIGALPSDNGLESREKEEIMAFALVLVATILAVIVLRDELIARDRWFYGGAAGLEALYGAGVLLDLPDVFWQPLYLLMQQAALSMALFVIVMFIGALPRKSAAFRHLMPVRSQLSILACILALGHMVVYLLCIPRLFSGGLVTAGVLAGFAVAVALTVLLAVLGPTSVQKVRERLGHRRWKAVQRWAYLFYGLTYGHLMLVLAPSVEQGVATATATAAVYTAVFAVYTVARIGRVVADSREFSFAMGHSKALESSSDETLHTAGIGR